MHKDLKLLLRLHEIYETKLVLYSVKFDCTAPRKGYEHEYAETKAIMELLDRLVASIETPGKDDEV